MSVAGFLGVILATAQGAFGVGFWPSVTFAGHGLEFAIFEKQPVDQTIAAWLIFGVCIALVLLILIGAAIEMQSKYLTQGNFANR